MEQEKESKQEAIKDAIDQNSNPSEYVKGDPVVYYQDSYRFVGKIENLYQENNVAKLEIKLRDDSTIKVKANDPYLQPLFFKNNQNGSKTYLRFSYQEVSNLLKQQGLFNIDYNALGKKNFNQLMLGGKTSVIKDVQLEKKNGQGPKEVFTVDGRFKLITRNNNVRVHFDTKIRELKIPEKMYLRKFSPEELEKLKSTKELGLVEGFTNKETGEVFKAWVSIDNELNKVVTMPEKAVYIDKYYGQALSKEQKETLKRGEGVVLEFDKKSKPGEKYKQYISVSAASTSRDGIKSMSEKKAKELNLVKEESQKKNKRAKI